MSDSFGQKLTLSTISFYRRHLSQTLFKGMSCSFPHDTCSSYARRNIGERGVLRGTKMTWERMHRCSDFKLYHMGDGLGWEKGFKKLLQEPDSLDDTLTKLEDMGESKHVLGHIANGSQALHFYLHRENNEDFARVIHDRKLKEFQPRYRGTNGFDAYFDKKLLKAGAVALGIGTLAHVLSVPDEITAVTMSIYLGHKVFTVKNSRSELQYFKDLARFR